MVNDITPEEKLLNIIKSGSIPPLSDETKPDGTLPNEEAAFTNLRKNGNQTPPAPASKNNFFGRSVSMKKLAPADSGALKGILIIPEILKVTTLVLTLLVLISLSYRLCMEHTVKRFIARTEQEATSASQAAQIIPSETATKPFEEYTDLNKKDIFQLSEGGPAYAPASAPARGETAAYVLQNYSLAGIILGSNPQALIEDKKQGKTYLLYKGESTGEITIDEIQKGKITIMYGGESVELTL